MPSDPEYKEFILARNRAWRKQYVDGLRKQVLAKYGSVCSCCGEHRQEFLAIEHNFGGENAHRKALQAKEMFIKLSCVLI
jgi:hypothetical protein